MARQNLNTKNMGFDKTFILNYSQNELFSKQNRPSPHLKKQLNFQKDQKQVKIVDFIKKISKLTNSK